MSFKITHKDKKTKARVGKLKTRSGVVETPFFMPVATKAAVKYMSQEDIKELGTSAIISNTFILHLTPGEDVIKKLNGIKKFMNLDSRIINVTDSGGFQMYSPSLYIKSTNKGVWFRNPINKQKLFITPEKDMEIQLDIGSDIAMCLDKMPMPSDPREKILEAVERTSDWAKRCKLQHDKIQGKVKKKDKQLLFGICQGGVDKKLRAQSAMEIAEIDFNGYAIGGLALGEPKELEYDMIKISKKHFPESKPCYLMGAGEPLELLEAIEKGVDMFDSRYPTQGARRGMIFTSKGKINLFNSKFSLDKSPLDKNCKCKVCKNKKYTKAYIRYQLKHEESIGRHLATYHNLYFLINLMSESRKAIKKAKFSEFKKNFERNYK